MMLRVGLTLDNETTVTITRACRCETAHLFTTKHTSPIPRGGRRELTECFRERQPTRRLCTRGAARERRPRPHIRMTILRVTTTTVDVVDNFDRQRIKPTLQNLNQTRNLRCLFNRGERQCVSEDSVHQSLELDEHFHRSLCTQNKQMFD